MDIGTIIGFFALAVSILGTLFSLFYTRQKTKVMEEQLEIVRTEAERKRTLEEVSSTIRQTNNMIKKHVDPEHFYFSPLDISGADLLAYMHDNHLKTLKLHIKNRSLVSATSNGKLVRVKTQEGFIQTMKSSLDGAFSGGIFNFDCDPDVLQNPHIDLGDAFTAITEFYRAHAILKSYDYAIEVFDNAILDELKQTIDGIVKAIFESLMSKHEISFSSADKSNEIVRKMQNELVGLDSIQKLLQKLSREICDQRLSAIQKEMFLKS